jgi:hypothetical protein
VACGIVDGTAVDGVGMLAVEFFTVVTGPARGAETR